MGMLLFIALGASLIALIAGMLLRRRWTQERVIVGQLLMPGFAKPREKNMTFGLSVPKGWPCAGERGMGGHA